MATVGFGNKSRDKKGFFVSSKEKGRREKLKNIWKRKCCNVEGDGGVSTKKKCIEDGSCNFRGRRVIELDVLARALDSGCRACGKALQLSNCHDETISGLGSFLYIMCSDPECGEVNVCTTNKSHRSAGAGRIFTRISLPTWLSRYEGEFWRSVLHARLSRTSWATPILYLRAGGGFGEGVEVL